MLESARTQLLKLVQMMKELNQYRGSWLHIHYPQLAVNPQNVTHPDLVFQQSYVTMLSSWTYKTSVMNLGHIVVSQIWDG